MKSVSFIAWVLFRIEVWPISDSRRPQICDVFTKIVHRINDGHAQPVRPLLLVHSHSSDPFISVVNPSVPTRSSTSRVSQEPAATVRQEYPADRVSSAVCVMAQSTSQPTDMSSAITDVECAKAILLRTLRCIQLGLVASRLRPQRRSMQRQRAMAQSSPSRTVTLTTRGGTKQRPYNAVACLAGTLFTFHCFCVFHLLGLCDPSMYHSSPCCLTQAIHL